LKGLTFEINGGGKWYNKSLDIDMGGGFCLIFICTLISTLSFMKHISESSGYNKLCWQKRPMLLIVVNLSCSTSWQSDSSTEPLGGGVLLGFARHYLL